MNVINGAKNKSIVDNDDVLIFQIGISAFFYH